MNEYPCRFRHLSTLNNNKNNNISNNNNSNDDDDDQDDGVIGIFPCSLSNSWSMQNACCGYRLAARYVPPSIDDDDGDG